MWKLCDIKILAIYAYANYLFMITPCWEVHSLMIAIALTSYKPNRVDIIIVILLMSSDKLPNHLSIQMNLMIAGGQPSYLSSYAWLALGNLFLNV